MMIIIKRTDCFVLNIIHIGSWDWGRVGNNTGLELAKTGGVVGGCSGVAVGIAMDIATKVTLKIGIVMLLLK